MVKILKTVLAMALLVIFTLTAGCDPQDMANKNTDSSEKIIVQQEKPADNTVNQKVPDNKAMVKIYFANEDGTKLVEKTKVLNTSGQDKYKAALELLIAGTKESGVVAMIPPNTKLREIKVKNGIAYVNFSKELVKNFNGGSAGEIMLVGSVVNTLTEFPEVKAVQFLIEGEVVETISGHMDISEPMKRFEDILKK